MYINVNSSQKVMIIGNRCSDYNSAKAELAKGRTNVNDYHYNRKVGICDY